MIPRRSSRGFALIAAIGVLAVLGLIVVALCDSLDAQRSVSHHWRAQADKRLALTWSVNALRANSTTASAEANWGAIHILALAEPLSADSPVYLHSALSPRSGDRLATIHIDDTTTHLLLRGGPVPTHHRLPPDLIPPEEASP